MASSITQTGLCYLTKIALLCNLLARLLCPWGLSWEMEAFYELQEKIASLLPHIVHWVTALTVFLTH